MKTFQDFVTAVQHFNRSILKVDQTGIRLLTQKEAEYTRACLIEEATEMYEAGVESDIAKQVDAFADSLYFGLGGLYRMGLSEEQTIAVLWLVHEANMTKKKGVNAKRDMGVQDAIKPEGFVAPEQAIAKLLGLK